MNRRIITATVVITAAGVANSILANKAGNVGNVLFAGWLLMLILSLADLAGGGISQLVGGIAMVAMVAALITLAPPLLAFLNAARSGNQAKT